MKKCSNILVIAVIIVFLASAAAVVSGEKQSQIKGKISESLLSLSADNPEEEIAVIITFRDNKAAKNFAEGGNLRRAYNLSPSVSANADRKLLERLAIDAGVARIEPVRIVSASLEPNIELVRADDTWQLNVAGMNITGSGKSVCVIDTGVDYAHPDLEGRVIAGYDFVNNDNDPMDDYGHGTHVAGIIAASGVLKGVAPDAKIVAVKALDENGKGSEDDIISAIEWCVMNAEEYDITAISMSLGTDCSKTPYCYSTFCDWDAYATSMAINNAVSRNISVVAATGNNANYVKISYPACIQNVIRVAAIDNGDHILGLANRGPGFPDIMLAPGYNIFSTLPNGGYGYMTGTSMATPHVSGTIALFAQAYELAMGRVPAPHDVESVLGNTGKPLYDAKTGMTFSRVDAYAAVESLITGYYHISVVSPLNVTYPYGGLVFNMTADADIAEAWFSVDGKGNQTLIELDGCWFNASFPMITDGHHNATFWAKSAAGLIKSAAVHFTVDSVAPRWSANSSSIVQAYSPGAKSLFSIAWDDLKIDSVFIEGNWSGKPRNYAMSADGSGNFSFSTVLPAGGFYWKSWANDTAGNRNSTGTMHFSVERKNVALRLMLNGSESGLSVNQSTDVNVTVILSENSNVTLCINGSCYQYNETSAVEKVERFTVPGLYGITAASHGNQNYTGNSSTARLEVNETMMPRIERPSLSFAWPAGSGENITVEALVYGYLLEKAWYEVTDSGGPVVASGLMSSAGYMKSAVFTAWLPPGSYNVTVFANDSTGHKTNESAGYFRIWPMVNFSFSPAWNETRVLIYYNGTGMKRLDSADANATNGSLPEGLWDIMVITPGFNATFISANATPSSSFGVMNDWNIPANAGGKPGNARDFISIAASEATFMFSEAKIIMGFNVSSPANRSHIGAYACHSWNMSSRTCPGSWESADADINLESNASIITASSLSAFAVSVEKYCGDGICDFTDTCSSCPADCGECPEKTKTAGKSGSSSYKPADETPEENVNGDLGMAITAFQPEQQYGNGTETLPDDAVDSVAQLKADAKPTENVTGYLSLAEGLGNPYSLCAVSIISAVLVLMLLILRRKRRISGGIPRKKSNKNGLSSTSQAFPFRSLLPDRIPKILTCSWDT